MLSACRLGRAVLPLALLLAAPRPAQADVSVRATVHPQRVQVGESVTLVIEVNGVQDAGAPAIRVDGFDARYVGPSTQISFVNGQVSASIQHRYSLLPLQPGQFTVGPFDVEYRGQRYQTASYTVDVVAAGQGRGQAQPGPAAGQAGPRSVRLELRVPHTEVYLHERIPVDVLLYVGNIRAGDLQYPTVPTDGMAIDKFPEPSQRQEVIDGETFQVVHFQTTAVPMRVGSLRIGPATLRLNIYSQRRSGFNDPFFDRFFQHDPFGARHPYDVRADAVTLNVLPLPAAGRPPTFSGAVGSFAMDVDAAPTELAAGDPVTMRIRVTGSGNLGDALAPQLVTTEGFRTYEPQVTQSDGNTKAFEQVIIPNDASLTAVPPVRFSYFDPRAREYRTIESPPIALAVRAPDTAPRVDITAGGVLRREAAEELGRDIVYIKDDPGRLAQGGQWYGNPILRAWQPVPLLLFIGALWYDRRRQRLSGDVRYARFTRAGKQARQGLAAAQQALTAGDRAGFYDAVSRTMQEYLAAKLDLPPGGIDAETVARCGVSEDCVQHVREFLATCEQVRFAPAAGDGDMRGTLALAQDVIRQLERTYQRSARRAATVGKPRHDDGRAQHRAGSAAALLVTVCALTPSASPAAPDVAASPQTTFFHANALYKDGQYAAAAKEYEALIASGVASGNVYFNLGNAYFKAGERGQAILNYERARRFIPADPDLAANLTYAQSLTGAEHCLPSVWERIAFPLAQRWASGGLFWLVTVSYSLAMVALALHRLLPARPRWLVYAAAGCGVLTIATGLSLARRVSAEEWQPHAIVVVAGETRARFEPAENGTVHFALPEGSRVRVLARREGWWQIARCDGRRGWIPDAAATDLD